MSATLDILKRVGIMATTFEKSGIHFNSEVLPAVTRSSLLNPRLPFAPREGEPSNARVKLKKNGESVKPTADARKQTFFTSTEILQE